MAITRNIYVFACALVVLALCLLSYSNNSLGEDVSMSKITQNVGAPTLKILYCYSCGYRKMYDQYVNILRERYPYILIDGGNFEPPGISMFLARLIGILKMVAIICIMTDVNIFEYINQPRPSWWIWCTSNKLYACMMMFFVPNIIEGQLIQSGAFEISLNDVPVWSKLETGRIPQPAELFQIIDSHMQFTDSKFEFSNGFAK